MTRALLALILFAQVSRVSPPAGATVTGRLINPDGSPATAVRVSAMPVPEPGRPPNEPGALTSLAETDSSGRYRLENVLPGRYYIVAGLIDTQTYYPGARAATEASVIDVVSGTTITLRDFQVLRVSTGLAVRGRVTREGNQPLGTPVQLNLGGSDQYLSASTKADGSFEFLKVRPGTYNISLNSAAGTESRNVIVADTDLTGIDFVLPWTVDVNGTVSVEGGGLQPNISVTFVGGDRENSVGGRQSFRTTLAEGAYAVVVHSVPGGYYLKSITAGSIDLTKEPIRLSHLRQPPAITIVMGVATPAPWVKVTGRVRGVPNTATPLTVSLNGQNLDPLSSPVAADGAFEFQRVLPGTYSLSVRTVDVPMPALSLTVPNADVNDVEISIPPATQVSGRLTVEDGGPLPRMSFTITGGPNGSDRISADSSVSLGQLLVGARRNNNSRLMTLPVDIKPDGTFKTTMPQGRYRLTVAPAPVYSSSGISANIYRLKSANYGVSDVMTSEINVGSQPEELKVLVAPINATAWFKVSGRVVGFAPDLGTTTVSLNSQAFLSPLTASVNPDGSFEFAKVYPGNYNATTLVSGPSLRAPNSFNGSVLPVPANVDVAGRDVSGVELKIFRRKQVAGQLRIEGPGSIIRFGLPLSPLSPGNATSNGTSSIRIDPLPDGSFRAEILEGEYQLGQADMPAGYVLRSVTYGSTDVTRNLLKVAVNDNSDLTVVIAAPQRKAVRVTGRIRGLNPTSQADPQIANLTSSLYVQPKQTTVAADGSFEFSEVFPGQYSLMVPGMATSTPITVSDTDVRDIEITVPGRKEIFGRVLVEGKGPLPRLSFRTTPSGTTASSPFSNFINISPRADTTFSVILPEGESSLQAPSGLPTGYAFKSMTYGAVDVMKSPLKVDPSDTSQLLVTVTSSANPVKVSGRAEGVDETAISRGIARATLTSPSFALPLNTTIKPDGTFEFAEVFPGNYQARLSGVPTGNAPGVAVVVGTSNVNDVQIVAPAQRSLSGKIEVDRGGVIPRVGLEITTEDPRGGTYGSVVTLNPQPDGTVRVTLPDGEHRLRLVQIPAGYEVSSFRYGSLDLLKSPIKLSRNDTADELRINLSVRGSAPPWVRISGRVLGQTAVVRALRVSLGNGTTVPLDTVVGQDGAFEFTQVLPGTYTLQVTAGIGFSTPPQPKIVTVGNSDLKDVDLSMRLPRLVQGRISVDGGVAAPWLTIDAKNRGGQIVSSTISNGRFLLMLEDGQHRIAIRDLPSNYSLRSILYGSTDLLTQPMNVAEGSEIAVTLSGSPVNSLPTFRMRGRIKGSLLRLPEPRKLIASGPSATDVREVEISADGRFVLASIPNGTYTLRIFGLGSTIVPPKTVTVAGKNLDGIEIEVPTQIQIAGRIVVTAAAQSPEPATAIVAEVQHSRGVYASTADINGSFSLLLPEGRHRVTLNGLPPTYRVQSIRYKSKVVKGGRFEVKPSDAGAEMEIIVGSVNAR